MVKRIAALVVVLSLLGSPALAEPKFNLEAGKTYLFTYECFPQVGCFAEPVTVIAWDKKANRVFTVGEWWINLATVRGIKELTPPPAEKPESSDPSLRVNAWTRSTSKSARSAF